MFVYGLVYHTYSGGIGTPKYELRGGIWKRNKARLSSGIRHLKLMPNEIWCEKKFTSDGGTDKADLKVVPVQEHRTYLGDRLYGIYEFVSGSRD